MDWFDDWALTLAVFLPAVGMAIVLFIPRVQEELIKIVTLVTSLATLGVGIAILADFNYDFAGLQFDVNEPWIDVIHSRYHIGIDGISLPLLVLSMFITVLCVVYSWNHFPEPHNPKGFLALVLLLEVGMNGTFVAQDLILFFIFFEVVLLPMFFMIGVWGGPRREYASIKFFLFTLFGSAMMLLSFIALFFLSKVQTFDMVVLTQLHGAGHRPQHAGPAVRGPVPRVRDQGAHVAVPHVAARRAHRGAHRGFGAAGRDPPEARVRTVSSASRSRSCLKPRRPGHPGSGCSR